MTSKSANAKTRRQNNKHELTAIDLEWQKDGYINAWVVLNKIEKCENLAQIQTLIAAWKAKDEQLYASWKQRNATVKRRQRVEAATDRIVVIESKE